MRRSDAIVKHRRAGRFVAMNATIMALPYAPGTETKHVGWSPDERETIVKTEDAWDIYGFAIATIIVNGVTRNFEFPYASRFDKFGDLDKQAIVAEVTDAVRTQLPQMKAAS
jgi:hypothetical protein